MRNAKPLPPSPDLQYAQILYGWREIASYLRRHPATVRRWHEQRPLPMAYYGCTVVIPRSALDLWVMQGRAGRRVA